MDIRAFRQRKAPERIATPTPSKTRLTSQKPRIDPGKWQETRTSAPEITPVVLGSPSPAHLSPWKKTEPASIERFIPKDTYPLPEDFDRFLDILRAANPDDIPTDLGQGQTITDRARFIESHLQILELLSDRPSSMLFQACFRRVELIVRRTY